MMKDIYNYVSVASIAQVLGMVSKDKAVCILNGLCRAQGYRGPDLVTKNLLDTLCSKAKINLSTTQDEINRVFLGAKPLERLLDERQLDQYLFETDYAFL